MEKAEFTFCLMKQEHISQVAALEQACFSSPWSEKALEEELHNPLAVFYVAMMGEQVAGYAGMHHVLDEGDICNIAVFPQFRRCGAARGLMEQLLCYGKENGLKQIMLEVRQSNLPAQALYRELGFQQVGRRKNFYAAPAEDALLLCIRLQP